MNTSGAQPPRPCTPAKNANKCGAPRRAPHKMSATATIATPVVPARRWEYDPMAISLQVCRQEARSPFRDDVCGGRVGDGRADAGARVLVALPECSPGSPIQKVQTTPECRYLPPEPVRGSQVRSLPASVLLPNPRPRLPAQRAPRRPLAWLRAPFAAARASVLPLAAESASRRAFPSRI